MRGRTLVDYRSSNQRSAQQLLSGRCRRASFPPIGQLLQSVCATPSDKSQARRRLRIPSHAGLEPTGKKAGGRAPRVKESVPAKRLPPSR